EGAFHQGTDVLVEELGADLEAGGGRYGIRGGRVAQQGGESGCAESDWKSGENSARGGLSGTSYIHAGLLLLFVCESSRSIGSWSARRLHLDYAVPSERRDASDKTVGSMSRRNIFWLPQRSVDGAYGTIEPVGIFGFAEAGALGAMEAWAVVEALLER